MKHLRRTSTWVIIFAFVASLGFVGHVKTDPTDDFSFTYGHVSILDAFRLMPEKRVKEILEDRLDLFPKSQAPKLARHLLSLCKQYKFDPAFVLALIQVESGFRIKVQSPNGALGLMQLMPATAAFTARRMGINLMEARIRGADISELAVATRLLKDPFTNITFGVAYLSMLRDRYRGRSPYFLVAAYNVGPARMDELLARKSFKPVATRKYFNAIRRGVPNFRFYRREA